MELLRWNYRYSLVLADNAIKQNESLIPSSIIFLKSRDFILVPQVQTPAIFSRRCLTNSSHNNFHPR